MTRLTALAAALALSLSAGSALAQTYAAPGASFNSTAATVGATASPGYLYAPAPRTDAGTIGHDGRMPARSR